MNDAFAPKNVRGLAKIIAHVSLLPNPIKMPADAGRQINLWLISGSANPLCAASDDERKIAGVMSARLLFRPDSIPALSVQELAQVFPCGRRGVSVSCALVDREQLSAKPLEASCIIDIVPSS